MFGKARSKKPHCSFCNRAEDVAGELISSPINEQLLPPPDHFVYICANCIAMCNQLLSDIHQEAEGTMPDEAALNSGAADNDGDDEGGPVLLPNGVPLRLQRWARRTSRPPS